MEGANVAGRSSVSGLRCFSNGKILGEEERAQENIYIQVSLHDFPFFFNVIVYFANLCSPKCCLVVLESIVIEYSELIWKLADLT